MKNLSIIITSIFILISFNSCKKGNGILITEEKNVSSFEKIEVSSSAKVNYHTSPETRVIVTVDENLLKYVKVHVKNNTLHITTKSGGGYIFSEYTVDVYSSDLTEVSISGSGKFDGGDKIFATNFEISISGSGKFNGTLECDKFSTNISGSGKINGNVECSVFTSKISGSGEVTLYGNTNNLDLKISGSGDFMGSNFITNNADIKVSGSGNVHTWAENYLKVHVSGSGSIYYRGNPKIDFSGGGSGKLISE